MKYKSIMAVLLTATLFACPVLANDLTPIVGTFTNKTVSVTNNVSDLYLVSSLVWGYFDGANECKMTVTVPGANTRPVVFASSSSATNTLSYIDGAAGLIWQRLSVLTFIVSSDGLTTNGYLIHATADPRR